MRAPCYQAKSPVQEVRQVQLPVRQRPPPAWCGGGEGADPGALGPPRGAGKAPRPGEMTSFLMDSESSLTDSESSAIRTLSEAPVARSATSSCWPSGSPPRSHRPYGCAAAPLPGPDCRSPAGSDPPARMSGFCDLRRTFRCARLWGASRGDHVPSSMPASYRFRAGVRRNAAWTKVKWSRCLRNSPRNSAH